MTSLHLGLSQWRLLLPVVPLVVMALAWRAPWAAAGELDLAYGSAVASIGLTILAVALTLTSARGEPVTQSYV